MAEATEHMEHAMHAEHASHTNRRIGLVIAVLALFLSFSETLGKSAQTEAISANEAWPSSSCMERRSPPRARR